MGMTPERAAEIAAGDPTFVPGARGQGRRRVQRHLGGQPGTVLPVPAEELATEVEDRPQWKRPVHGMQTYSEKKFQAARREWLAGRLTDEDWDEIVDTWTKQAKRGDPVARADLMAYLMGRPSEKVEVEAKLTLADMVRRAIGDSETVIDGEVV